MNYDNSVDGNDIGLIISTGSYNSPQYPPAAAHAARATAAAAPSQSPSAKSAASAAVPIQNGPSAPFAAQTQLSTSVASSNPQETAAVAERKRNLEVFRA